MTENKNAFKHWINQETVSAIAKAIAQEHSKFDVREFSKVSGKLPALELKPRVLEITKQLKAHLPEDYPKSLSILVRTIKNSELKGFTLWPFSEYISQFGLNHFDSSLEAMETLTEKFTAEFSIRPFLLKNSKNVFQFLSKRTGHSNVHVRRWISEGTRPYLPWGQKVPEVADNPELTLRLLEKLKDDDELYVRKSVANHLNDHSKKHPELVVQTLQLWENKSSQKNLDKILWIKRHALRTLIKKGHRGALKLMGVDQNVKINVGDIKLNKKNFKIGDSLDFEFEVKSTAKKSQRLIIDYAIDFLKANGKHGTKVFKLKTVMLESNQRIIIKKTHSLKMITTMKFYSGVHGLSVQINGIQVSHINWKLS